MNAETWEQLKSLFHSALEVEESQRAAFLDQACEGNAELRSRVERLLVSHEEAGSFLVSPALLGSGINLLADGDNDQRAVHEKTRVGQRIGPYEIVREIGHGGMGTVFLAARADESFDKQVALKLIKRGMDSDSIIKRFLMERQILANLDHSNIARLIDGGTTEDGLPYFVMEYIEGKTITRYCDEHKLNTLARLKLFGQVCEAVQFAHQNLIVHRDLKPSNINVTADGTPKLLDFGIAKLLNPERSFETHEATATMMRLLTPEYASPEQLRGLPITTASDVYSLGVILYELLSGHRPYNFESHLPEEMVRLITASQPIKPSVVITRIEAARHTDDADQISLTPEAIGSTRDGNVEKLRRRLTGDLDNILLKALRKEPARRYVSVQGFSEDIRRHLEGLPVTASPDTFSYRAAKFVQRNRGAVLAAACMIITLFSATAITSWQAVVAHRQRARAERRFGEIRKLSNSLIAEVQSSLVNIPGTAPTQRLLAQKSLDYLDSLAQDDDKNVGVLGELASAYLSVGHLQVWTLQDNAGALRSYQKAVAIQRTRILLAPNDPTMKTDLVFGLFKLSEALEGLGRQEELFQTCDEQIELLKTLLVTDPANEEHIWGLGGSYERRGDLLRTFKRSEEAKADFRSALVSVKQEINLRRETARDPQARVNLSFAYIQQGSAFTDLGEWENAVESYKIAGQIAEAVYRENPGLTQALRNVSSSHNHRGDALDKLGDYRGALENYRYSLKVVTEARARNPNSSEMRYAEAKYTVKVGFALHKVGEVSDSFTLVRKGLGLSREYIAEDRSQSATVLYGVELFQQSADFFAGAGQREEAIAVYQEALQILERLAAETTPDSGVRNLIASYDTAVGDIYASFDIETKTIKATSQAALLKARNRYQQSLDTLRNIQNRGVFFSDLASRLEEVSQKLSACDLALARLKS